MVKRKHHHKFKDNKAEAKKEKNDEKFAPQEISITSFSILGQLQPQQTPSFRILGS
jgi:hypothetical protein